VRLLLDAHPEIGCPAEAGLPSLMSHMAGVWMTVNADERPAVDKAGVDRDPGQNLLERPGPAGVVAEVPTDRMDDDAAQMQLLSELPAPAREWIHRSVNEVMTRYCSQSRKRLYIDKSLDSVHHLTLVRELFPEMRCVLVFRHVMDTIASGIEASPWGFSAYGYTPYVQATPGNTVAALANYWLTHVGLALKWEQQHQNACLRVRYEDLVLKPEDTIRSIQHFLCVDENESVLERAFKRAPARGPGDYKVEYTTSIHHESIGHGKRVPVSMLPGPLLKAMNDKLQALGYEPINQAWNAVERPVDASRDSAWADRLSALMAQLRIPPRCDGVDSFALVAEDCRALRWVIDPAAQTIAQGDGEVTSVLTGTAEDLVHMMTGSENLGVLLRTGRIRHLLGDEDGARQWLGDGLRSIFALLHGAPTHVD
jgi:Sulfotransferase family